MALDMEFFSQMEARIPKGEVRTRFAPSPTGYMHVGNLRTALYTYLIARRLGGKFILRIEDTDQERLVEGAVDVIYAALRQCGLTHDEGPDVGGPVGPYVQTERRELYGKYAELLIEKGGAYRCFCKEGEGVAAVTLPNGDTIKKHQCGCGKLSREEIQARMDAGEPNVVRQVIPQEGSTTFSDAVYGEITTPNNELDENVLLKSDGLPTYNFANVIDDHLMGITHVVRGSEYLSSSPKYNLLYEAYGWEIPTYVHCPPFMRVNFVALLGWSPGGERELYTLEELAGVFDLKGVSKSPSVFDIAKLRWMNAAYIKAMDAEDFYKLAEPYLKEAVKTPSIDLKAVAALLQPRCEVLTDLAERVDFLDELPDYDISLYVHKKSKTTQENALTSLQAALPALEKLEDWSNDALFAALSELAASLGVKNAIVLWPVRVAVSGKLSTPGGATELCALLGKEESIKRVRMGIEKLS